MRQYESEVITDGVRREAVCSRTVDTNEAPVRKPHTEAGLLMVVGVLRGFLPTLLAALLASGKKTHKKSPGVPEIRIYRTKELRNTG